MSAFTSFSFYYDAKFWLPFLLVLLLFRLLNFNNRLRNPFLLISSILMIVALPGFDILDFMVLLVLSLLVFVIGRLLNGTLSVNHKSRRVLVSSAAITSVVLVLCFFKYGWLQRALYQSLFREKSGAYEHIFIIGISYFSFKMIHFIIECHRGGIDDLKLVSFANYAFFFPAFISGPIARYNQFCHQLRANSLGSVRDDLAIGGQRIVHGLFKKLVLCTIVFPYAIVNLRPGIDAVEPHQMALGLYAYALYFYFDFSGYSDIAIGAARMLGIGLPENFDNPFMKRNIQQLWAGWHMSLTRWLTDYVYWPLSGKLRNIHYFRKRPILLSNICIVITFAVCGMWHGETLNFVIWGVYHGIGLAGLNIYQKYKRRVRNRLVRGYFMSKYSELVGVVATFSFFAFGILFFSFGVDEVVQLVIR